jgi:phosphoglycolate phosphatase
MTAPLIVFDLDGTLLDTAPDLVAALNAATAAEGLAPLAIDDVRDSIGHGARGLTRLALEHAGRAEDPDLMARVIAKFLGGYEAKIAVMTRPFPGAVEALNRLAERGFRFAVCTNKREHLARLVLDALGLTDRFAAISGGDTFAASKPDARHLLGTITLAGGDPARALMVGDSRTDIDAARNAGVPVIAVRGGYTDLPIDGLGADVVIDGFDDLDAAVERLLPAD